MQVSEYLPKGAKSAKTSKELRESLNLTDNELRIAIRAERMRGVLICSRTRTDEYGKAGYFIPVTASELLETIKSLRSREREIQRVRKALEKGYKQQYGDE